ncbi:hypothetical protein [Actinocorallia sp. A-T 12471]|uniref:hypothetical protein n=1 Tax=Actinocorallia sp. A-T 12471 TaxID=3089813 RepID=UPI0029D2D4F2|nr:hypothetical protein [Actinocorallia sp. A-T 12471]MDX6738153.1 hypothetical protein [Actinocorallia sp. A-T 12471]
MISPELVNATQLSQWASTRASQDRFPELIRRLLASTRGITGISVRSGDGVAAPGWDGRAKSEGTPFLPSGDLCFEFGVNSNPKSKADSDYKNRLVGDAGGVERKKVVFIFVTPRRWFGAEKWASDHRAKGDFADVRVLDADDLEGWLQQTPAVHFWISEHLGYRPKGAESLDSWWERFQSRTMPCLPAQFYQSGRDEERARLLRVLNGRPDAVSVRSGWREESLAFIVGVLTSGEQKDDFPPVLVISQQVIWDRVIAMSSRAILIPIFENIGIGPTLEAGHHVIMPLGHGYIAVYGSVIELPRVSRRETEAILESVGITDQRAYDLAALARRSMQSMTRALSKDPAFTCPPWARSPSDAAVLAPLILLGSWSERDFDLSVASTLSGTSWPEIERVLLHWQNTDDPPFIRTGSGWYVTALVEAFHALHPLLSSSVMRRWQEILVTVFNQIEDASQINRREGAPSIASPLARRGLAQGLALLGTEGGRILGDVTSCASYARRNAAMILRQANSDLTGATWDLLDDALMFIAEGSPETFLTAVHGDLDRADPVLRTLFQDGEGSSGRPAHTSLLWALEILCWSPDHRTDAAFALARLHLIDPGGRWANRPLESLISVLFGSFQNTQASQAVKIKILETICRRLPEARKDLLSALLSISSRIITAPQEPRFRDWRSEDLNTDVSDPVDYVSSLVNLAIDAAQEDVEIWTSLVGGLHGLPASERHRILIALRLDVSSILESGHQAHLWEKLREKLIQFESMDLDEQIGEGHVSDIRGLVELLEPRAGAVKYAYLFGSQPVISGWSILDNHRSYREELQKLRSEAARVVLGEGGIAAINELSIHSAVPEQLGYSLGEVAPEEMTGDLAAWLDSTDQSQRSVAVGWARKRLHDGGEEWLRSTLRHPSFQLPERRILLVLNAPAIGSFWDVILEADPDLHAKYWSQVSEVYVEVEDLSRAAREYIDHDRPWLAVDLLQAWTRQEEGTEPASLDLNLVQEALDRACAADHRTAKSAYPGFGVGRLIDYLSSKGLSRSKIAFYEFIFYDLLDRNRDTKALFSVLNEDPSKFVDMVNLAYKEDHARPRSMDEQARGIALRAWDILRGWPAVPGVQSDGSIDNGHLKIWVETARSRLSEIGRAKTGDKIIGQILSSHPASSGEVWPVEAVREIIDLVGSQQIDEGFIFGTLSRRGITRRDVFEGGSQERELAKQYRLWAHDISYGWPRTSRLLREIAEDYEMSAIREDSEATSSADTE